MVRDTARGYAQDKLFPRAARLPRGALRPRRGVRDGRARPARPHHPGGVRRGRPRLRGLRADHPRDRARRFRLPLGDVGAVLAGHASDLRLRQRGAAPQVSPQAGRRRDRRLLRAHRARSRLRSGLDGDARGKGAGRLPPHRQQDVDQQLAGRRPRGGLGEARRRHPRLPGGARHAGSPPQDRRQAVAAHLDHRRDRARGCIRAGGEPAAQRAGAGRAVRLPQRGARRHRLGRDRDRRVLLAPRAPVRARPQAVRPPAGGQPAGAEEARRHADRDHARPARGAAARPAAGGGAGRRRRCRCSSATIAARRWRSRVSLATCTAATASPTSST